MCSCEIKPFALAAKGKLHQNYTHTHTNSKKSQKCFKLFRSVLWVENVVKVAGGECNAKGGCIVVCIIILFLLLQLLLSIFCCCLLSGAAVFMTVKKRKSVKRRQCKSNKNIKMHLPIIDDIGSDWKKKTNLRSKVVDIQIISTMIDLGFYD